MGNRKRYSTDDYAEVNESLKATNDPNQPTGGTGGSGSKTEDYYQLARDQEYGVLFDKEIQLENARANAQKYAQNQINASGFGNTGYGSTIGSGIYNEYMNKVMGAQKDYNDAVRQINLEETQANEQKANDRFASVTTMLTQASDVAQMDKLLGDYGYLQKDANGNIMYDENGNAMFLEEKPEGMSDDDWYQIQYYYNLQKDGLGESGTNGIQTTENLVKEWSKKAFNDDGTIKDQTAYARYSYYQLQLSGYYVQGLSDGRDTDDIDITIGSNNRNSKEEFDLLAGSAPSMAVSNDLNTICNGQQQKGQLVLYNGKLYIFTGGNGWKTVAGDHSKVEDCIQAITNLIGGGK